MIGARLGQWVLDSEIGYGGMGRVFRATAGDGQVAAVKVLAPELTTHTGAVSRFQREIDVLNQLNHPNIVRLYESGTYQEQLYFVMEYIPGRDYAAVVRDQGRVGWPEVLDMAIQVCAALKHAHDQGVIHRDLKPSNLLRTPQGQVKLTDFGVAHVFAGKHLTRTGAVVGTAEYLSPEQAAGKPASKRSDLYSLGVVLYTLLTGRNPFQGANVVDLLHKHRYARFDPPIAIVPELPRELNDVVCELLEKEPERRPADAGLLQRRLELLRQKLDNRVEQTMATTASQPTQAGTQADVRVPDPDHGEGPATLMSRLLRQELDLQNYGGSLRRFLNRPVVLVTLFAACVGVLVWAFWPPSAQWLFEKGSALMESDDPHEWETAWRRYLDPLEEKYPDHPYKEELERYRRKRDEPRTAGSRQKNPLAAPLSEAAWFYHEGLRQRLHGDLPAARRTWQSLVCAFRDVPGEKTWVKLAEEELAKENAEGPADDRRWQSVRAALDRARMLRDSGKPEVAAEVLKAIEELYRNDPSARAILEEVQRERGPQ
jgi:serine/threonine protein kinase